MTAFSYMKKKSEFPLGDKVSPGYSHWFVIWMKKCNNEVHSEGLILFETNFYDMRYYSVYKRLYLKVPLFISISKP